MWNGLFSPTFTRSSVNAVWEPMKVGQNIADLFSYIDDDASHVKDGKDNKQGGTAKLKPHAKPSSDASNNYLQDAYTSDQDGILWVGLTSKRSSLYAFPCNFGDYLRLQESGFDMATFNDIADINYCGDWGWPWGRTERTGWAAEDYTPVARRSR